MYHRTNGLVSVVITNYNNQKYIEECLDSILKQTYKDIELILIDDASTDNSDEIIRKWIKKNVNKFKKNDLFTYIKLPRNIGFSGAITLGFFLARGEFIAVQDGDDISHEERIKRQVNYLRKNNNISVVGTNYNIFENNLKKLEKANWLKYGVDKIRESYKKGNHCVCHGTILFRGKVFDKLGGLTRKFDGAEDYEVISKFINEGVENLKETLYYYRAHPNQRSRHYYKKKAKKT